MQFLVSFGCGLSFVAGAVAGIVLTVLAQKCERNAIMADFHALNKQIENRLATQVATMAACLEAIRKQGEPK